MKKKLIGLAVFGVVLATIGGSGAVVYYQKADKQMKQKVAESYQVKDKKNNAHLELSLRGNVHYSIEQSTDEAFHLNGETYSTSKEAALAWEQSEKDGKTAIAVNFNNTGQEENTPFSFGMWHNYYDSVTLSVPKSFETLTITSETANLSLSDLTTNTLTMASTDGFTELTNLRLTNLVANNDAGGLTLNNVIVEKESTISSQDGEISITDMRSETLTLKNRDERIYLEAFIGTSIIDADYGDVYLANLKGPTTVLTVDGNIYWQQDKLTDDSQLTTTDGSITVDLANKIKQLDVTAKTKSGEVSLLDKETKTLKKGTSGPKLQLTSTYGDITLSDNVSYEEEFDEFDDYE